jgi:hypothetical protein
LQHAQRITLTASSISRAASRDTHDEAMSNGVRNEPTLQVLPADDAAGRESMQDQAPSRSRIGRRSRRRRARNAIAVIVAILALGAVVSMLWHPQGVEVKPAPSPPAPRASAEAAPGPRYPIEAAAAALPPLDGSDAAMIASLGTVFADGANIVSYLQPQNVVRNFVTTVDNLPRRTLSPTRVPLKPPEGAFGAARSGENIAIDAANALRYRPYVALLSGVDSAKLVQLYVRHYPLFQQAYRELGYPNGHFNDRLVESIDVLLATPEHAAPVKLVQPRIFYEFADRDLEKLPAGQKLLLRMGPDNAATVKTKLVELRALVIAQPAAR